MTTITIHYYYYYYYYHHYYYYQSRHWPPSSRQASEVAPGARLQAEDAAEGRAALSISIRVYTSINDVCSYLLIQLYQFLRHPPKRNRKPPQSFSGPRETVLLEPSLEKGEKKGTTERRAKPREATCIGRRGVPTSTRNASPETHASCAMAATRDCEDIDGIAPHTRAVVP